MKPVVRPPITSALFLNHLLAIDMLKYSANIIY